MLLPYSRPIHHMLILTGISSKSSFREDGSVGVLCFYGNETETPCPLVPLASKKALSGSVVQALAGVASLPSSSQSRVTGRPGPLLCYYRWQIVPLAEGTQVFPVLLVSSSDSSIRCCAWGGEGASACYLESPHKRRRQGEGQARAGWTG